MNLRKHEHGVDELSYNTWKKTNYDRDVVMKIYSYLCKMAGKKPRRKKKAPALI